MRKGRKKQVETIEDEVQPAVFRSERVIAFDRRNSEVLEHLERERNHQKNGRYSFETQQRRIDLLLGVVAGVHVGLYLFEPEYRCDETQVIEVLYQVADVIEWHIVVCHFLLNMKQNNWHTRQYRLDCPTYENPPMQSKDVAATLPDSVSHHYKVKSDLTVDNYLFNRVILAIN